MMQGFSIDDEVYAVLSAHLTPAQLVDYVMLVGEFVLVSLTLNVFQIALDPGLEPMPGESRS
jgi:hypothetical protein